MISTDMLKIVDIDKIYIGERFRENLDLDADFIESIKDKGIFQPITIRECNIDNYKYELMAGRRRLGGSLEAGLSTIPALVRELSNDELDLREIELFENVFRKDPSWQDQVDLIDRINKLWEGKHTKTPWKWSQRKLAKMLGISNATASRDLNLAKAIKAIPELKSCATAKDARKMLRRMEDKLAVKEAVKELKKSQEEDKSNSYITIIENNYKIGDAIEGLRELVKIKKAGKGWHGISLVEVDPPYAIDLQNTKRKQALGAKGLSKYNEISKENYPKFLYELASLVYESLDDHGWCVFWFGQDWFTDVKIALVRAGFDINTIPAIWVKPNGQTNSPSTRLASAYEMFFIARKGQPTINIDIQGRSNVFAYRNVPQSEKYHPTQKPINLMLEIFKVFGSPGKTCVCPFLGSGVTMAAALESNMRCIGWDLSGEYKPMLLSYIQEREFHKNEK